MVVCRQNENATRNRSLVGGAQPKEGDAISVCEERSHSNSKSFVSIGSSDESRIAQLARPPQRLFAPSRAELEKRYAESQRRRIASDRKRNEKTCHDAIHNPQTLNKVKPRELTIPLGFNLSRSNTPSRSRCTTPARSACTTPSRSRCTTPARSVCSDDGSDYELSTRRGRVSSRAELTVPRGPNLQTASRQRSLSRSRTSDNAADAHLSTTSRSKSRQASSSPARAAFNNNQNCMVTPRPRRSPRHDDSFDSISSDMAISLPCSSVRSRMERSCDSRSSRISQLSQRSSSRRHLSTEEIEELRIAAKRHEVKAMMKRNQKRGRSAILCPDSLCTRRSLSLTVPREFNLSCPVTPSRSTCMSDADSDGGESVWAASLRSVSASPAPRAWEPELTVPEGPRLRTSLRSRSQDRDATTRIRSSSRNKFPREQAAIERHIGRMADTPQNSHEPVENTSTSSRRAPHVTANAAAAKIGASEEVPCAQKTSVKPENLEAQFDAGCEATSVEPPSNAAEWDDWVKAAASLPERAQRARRIAELKHKKQTDIKDSKLKVFTGPKASHGTSVRGGHNQRCENSRTQLRLQSSSSGFASKAQ